MYSCYSNNNTQTSKCNNKWKQSIFGDNEHEVINSYCSAVEDNNLSLDTSLYILQSKRGQINVMDIQDDSKCSISEKASVDLTDYPEGEYIISVGGYGQEYGNYLIHLECVPAQSENIPYNAREGWGAYDYFEKSIDDIDVAALPELQCYDHWSSWHSKWIWNTPFDNVNYYVDTTSPDELVKYYKFTLTSAMKQTYTYSLSLSTCCDIDTCHGDGCGYLEQAAAFTWKSLDDIDWDPPSNGTDEYCNVNNANALDTYLYLLQEKKGDINVIASVDDASCSNTQQSYIDLSSYPEGWYLHSLP